MTPYKNTTIALVENDLPTNRALARLLRVHGFQVETYLSGEHYFARTSAAVIDCLLLDVDLDGMSGLDVQEQLRAQAVATPIVFVTGRDDPAVRARAVEGGCAHFLNKPVESHMLVEAIDGAISGSRIRTQ